MGKFPCQDCPGRHPGCYAECERYQEAKAEYDKARAVKKRETEARGMLNDYERDNIRRARNR